MSTDRVEARRTACACRPPNPTPIAGCAIWSRCCRKARARKEFLEHTKLELFHDQVFCFTPKGQLIALPKGATPIDFAYAVHTSIGDSCVGCRINGRHAPLVTELENGDEVEIIRSEAQVPPAAWEGLAVTGKARAAIRRATRAAVRRQYAGLGREIVERLLAKNGARACRRPMSRRRSPKLGHKNVEDALGRIGRGELAAADMLKAMGYRGQGLRRRKQARAAASQGRERGSTAIPVRGVGRGPRSNISLETGAVPGERIVGILMPGEGITVYPIFAKALESSTASPSAGSTSPGTRPRKTSAFRPASRSRSTTRSAPWPRSPR